MEFKSQICTSKEQSKKLLALGLKKETADMMLYNDDENNPNSYVAYCIAYPDIVNNAEKNLMYKIIENRCIPAWSLSRLIELMPFNVGKYSEFGLFLSKNTLEIMDVEEGTTDTFWDSEDVYENVIASIEWLIKEGYFNKDYLEETK